MNKTFEEYTAMFNDIVNKQDFGESVYAQDLKWQVLQCIENSCKNLKIVCPYVSNKEFYIPYKGTIKSDFYKIEYNIEVTFSISAKRSDKIVKVSKLQNKYLYYIAENPIKFSGCKISINFPWFKFTKELKIKQEGCTCGDTIGSIKAKKNDTIQSIIDKINSCDDIPKEVSSNVIQPIVKRAAFNKEYREEINFDRFVDESGHFKNEELFQYIIDNNMLVKI